MIACIECSCGGVDAAPDADAGSYVDPSDISFFFFTFYSPFFILRVKDCEDFVSFSIGSPNTNPARTCKVKTIMQTLFFAQK